MEQNELKMKIKTQHSKTIKKVEDVKVTSYEEYDKYGKEKTSKYVEYTVLGNNRSWTGFMPLDKFKKLNPKVNI